MSWMRGEGGRGELTPVRSVKPDCSCTSQLAQRQDIDISSQLTTSEVITVAETRVCQS